MDYFAYGSNINLEHLKLCLAKAGVDPDDITDVQHPILPRYSLRTNYFSRAHCAGACNIDPTQSSIVEGVTMAFCPFVFASCRAVMLPVSRSA